MAIYHCWVGCYGLVYGTSKVCPVKNKKYTYVGFTSNVGYPKVMNTGRIFYKPNIKAQKKIKKKRKMLVK